MLKKPCTVLCFVIFVIFLCGCSVLNPQNIRYKILHLEDELFSQATITMPVLVTSTYTLTPSPIPTLTPVPTETFTPSPTVKPTVIYSSPTFEYLPTESLPLSQRDGISQITDITIPDDTTLKPNQLFIKSWRMTNSGPNTWEEGTRLMLDTTFDTGLPTVVKAIFLKENDWIDFTPGGWGNRVYNVAPGTRVDMALILRAPSQAGSYQIQFRLVNKAGEIVNTPFWMRFFVVGPTQTPTPEPPTATPVPPTGIPHDSQGTAIAVSVEKAPETPVPEGYNWTGHWMVREPFKGEEILPAHAWLYQSGEEVTGFIYDSAGNPVIVKGAVFDNGRTFNGEMFYPWQKDTSSVVWRMQATRDQFYAVTPLGVVTDAAVCGGRDGANLPDYCALPAGA